MIDFNFESECYLCNACISVCPKLAISAEKTLMPHVDQEKCVNCGLCNKVCPKYQEKKYTDYFPDSQSYIAKSKDNYNRLLSSSGGIFYHLASYAISSGWAVCGCIYDDYMMPKHIVTKNLDIISKMRGSKYVQSAMQNSLLEVCNLLRQDQKILFSGTPCQIAAVQNITNYNNNLYTVAVACHGSIDRKFWEYYLKEESKKHGEIVSVRMRDKGHGWLNYGLKFTFINGSEHTTYRNEDGYFLQCFTEGLFERERCLNCKYKGSQINADILLADAWGINKIYPNLDDEKGLSSVICITKKGQMLFDKIHDKVIKMNIETDEIIKRNQRIISPASRNSRMMAFQKSIDAHPDQIQEICENAVKIPLIKKQLLKLYSKFR